ncbi:hypothetical protein B0H12DRAFT_1228988 [Mycena haematopus]|nr:hypothetical protein B0H12DRAFT_1228988 [Mycena haematopus]
MSNNTEVNNTAVPDADDIIGKFLRAFVPSLDHLKGPFLAAGIETAEQLECFCVWPRKNVADFFSNHFRDDGLDKNIVDAFVSRFKDRRCQCHGCPSLLEPDCIDYKVKLK